MTAPPDGIHYNETTRIDSVRITDLDFNGVVSFDDLLRLLINWG